MTHGSMPTGGFIRTSKGPEVAVGVGSKSQGHEGRINLKVSAGAAQVSRQEGRQVAKMLLSAADRAELLGCPEWPEDEQLVSVCGKHATFLMVSMGHARLGPLGARRIAGKIIEALPRW